MTDGRNFTKGEERCFCEVGCLLNELDETGKCSSKFGVFLNSLTCFFIALCVLVVGKFARCA